MEKTELKFLLAKSPFEEEIISALKLSKPIKVSGINFGYKNIDFETGNFDFLIRGKNKRFISIPFASVDLTLNKFINFIEEIDSSDKPLIFYVFNKGVEYIIYSEKIDSSDIRFTVLNTDELYKKEREGQILSYSFIEAEVCFDITINKKIFIKEIQSAMKNIVEKYRNVAYFEQKNFNI